jgi:hypothetical protein
VEPYGPLLYSQAPAQYSVLRKASALCPQRSVTLGWPVLIHNPYDSQVVAVLEAFRLKFFLPYMEKVGWTDRVRNEDVLHGPRRRGISYIQQKEGRLTGLVTYCMGTAF